MPTHVFKANHANTLWGKRTVFARSPITPPKLNRFDEIWNSMSQMLGLALVDFGDPRSSDSLPV